MNKTNFNLGNPDESQTVESEVIQLFNREIERAKRSVHGRYVHNRKVVNNVTISYKLNYVKQHNEYRLQFILDQPHKDAVIGLLHLLDVRSVQYSFGFFGYVTVIGLVY